MEYSAFLEHFGRYEIVLALIHPKDVLENTFLKKLKAFHQELEETVPHLDEVRSLVNVTSMRGEEGALIIEELMEDRAKVKMELHADEKLCATGKGLFVAVKEGHPAYHRW